MISTGDHMPKTGIQICIFMFFAHSVRCKMVYPLYSCCILHITCWPFRCLSFQLTFLVFVIIYCCISAWIDSFGDSFGVRYLTPCDHKMCAFRGPRKRPTTPEFFHRRYHRYRARRWRRLSKASSHRRNIDLNTYRERIDWSPLNNPDGREDRRLLLRFLRAQTPQQAKVSVVTLVAATENIQNKHK